VRKIYVDSNIFVDAEIPERKFHKESKKFLESVLSRHDMRVYTSVYTLLEIASAITRQIGKRNISWKYLYNVEMKYKEGQVSWIYPTRKDEVFDFERLVRALIETSIQYYTPSGDTIHAHTLIANRIRTLITRNKDHFQHLKGRDILTPEEFLEKFK
jgi:predicted nucleic acid-binding protein